MAFLYGPPHSTYAICYASLDRVHALVAFPYGHPTTVCDHVTAGAAGAAERDGRRGVDGCALARCVALPSARSVTLESQGPGSPRLMKGAAGVDRDARILATRALCACTQLHGHGHCDVDGAPRRGPRARGHRAGARCCVPQWQHDIVQARGASYCAPQWQHDIVQARGAVCARAPTATSQFWECSRVALAVSYNGRMVMRMLLAEWLCECCCPLEQRCERAA